MGEPAVARLMTRHVITAVPDTPFRELVGTMIVHDLDALPIIDLAGRPVGVVTEVDALAKVEFHGGADYLPLLAGSRCRARWRKSSGLTAADLMTTPAPTTTADTPLTTAVHALTTEGVRQLFVVDSAGRLAGVVTRHDVLRLFLRSDSAIQADIERDAVVLVRGDRQIAVQVADGVVTLQGTLTLRSTTENVCRVAQCVPGVVTVHNNLRYDVDDLMITGL